MVTESYHVLVTLLGTGDVAVNKTDMLPALEQLDV